MVHMICFWWMTHTAAFRSLLRLSSLPPEYRASVSASSWWDAKTAPNIFFFSQMGCFAVLLSVWLNLPTIWGRTASPACCHICSPLATWLAFLLLFPSPLKPRDCCTIIYQLSSVFFPVKATRYGRSLTFHSYRSPSSTCKKTKHAAFFFLFHKPLFFCGR